MRIIKGVRTIAGLMRDLHSMSSSEKADFYKDKCDYYQGIVELSLIVACLTTICFIYSDYMINGSALPTLIPRLSILVFIAIFFVVTDVRESARVIVFMDFFLGQGMVIAASWAAYNLSDNSNSITGIIVVNLLWMVIGFVATPIDTLINGFVFIIEIIITNSFNHYTNYDVILSLEIPCIIGIVVVHYIMTAFYLDHYRVTQKLKMSMITDPLTMVYNRHLLEKIVQDNSLKIQKPGEPITLVMLDIDDFKKINDENGHYTGDLALCFIGQKLNNETHKDDYVIRYGGEEFVLIFRNCSVNDACARMEQFRTEIENAKDIPVPFTVSIGVSGYTGDYYETLKRVDEALYEAKNTGKNKVVIK
ncbi:GGDEF domain-containing protein [Butyrivibrio sp. JL13D10]|uniref:GGDEF domain-containing protein n=1 Tax=Butyrivibrio sp. JL13D10 TaxID=3236815 RepID=UPI0038B463CA